MPWACVANGLFVKSVRREIKPLIISIRNISLRKLKEEEGALYLYVSFDCLEQFCNTQYSLPHSTVSGHHYGKHTHKSKQLKNVSSIAAMNDSIAMNVADSCVTQ